MKHFYPIFIGLILLASCSKDDPGGDNPDQIALKACFETSKDTLSLGESLDITSCSEGANAFSYNFGNGKTSSKENPSMSYEEGGDFNISLTVTNEAMETKTFSKEVHVLSTDVESNYLFPNIAEGFTAMPLEAGINPTNGGIYLLQLLEDNIGTGGSKFYYNELDVTYEVTSTYLADKPFNSNSAFVNFYANGNKNFIFSRTLDGLYGTQEFTYNAAWGFVNGINSATKHSYGYLVEGTNYLYFGTEKDGEIYKTSVETRNSSGDAFQVSLNAFGSADSMIGDMIKTSSGYAAFGAIFTKNATAPHISGYTPLLIFFDNGLNVTDHFIFENSVLDTKINSSNDLNGSFHLAQLSNGNFAMFGVGELIVTDSSGSEINRVFYEQTKNNQAMISLGDSFIISTEDYLRKFDVSGSETEKLKYNGNYLPEILEIGNTLFFAAGYDLEGEVKIFYGASDKDLNLINLNQ